MATYTRPAWVNPGEQWYAGQTQLQFEQAGGKLAPGVSSVLPKPTSVTTTPTTTTPATTTPTTPTTTPTSTYTGVSIVDFLKSLGLPSDFNSRADLAKQYGITNYTGTAAQNIQLLNTLGVDTSTATNPPAGTPAGKTTGGVQLYADGKGGVTTTKTGDTGAGDTTTEGYEEGDERINPTTGKKERLTPLGWRDIDAKGNTIWVGDEKETTIDTGADTGTTGDTGTDKTKEELKEELEAKIAAVKKELEDKLALLEAAKAQGVTGEMEIPQSLIDAMNGIKDALDSPDEDERAAALKEAEEYYSYTLPTDMAEWSYPEVKAEIEKMADMAQTRTEEDYTYQLDEIGAEKSNLLKEYENYLEDLETGKLRVGSDYQLSEERRLEQKKEFLDQHEFTLKQGLETLHRGWVGKGGLWAGPRFEAAATYGTQAGMEKERYLSQYEYGGKVAETGYERRMEDYLTQEKRGGEAYQTGLGEIGRRTGRYEQLKERGMEDIALGRIKDIRSLQEKFQEAVAGRMATTLGEKYYG